MSGFGRKCAEKLSNTHLFDLIHKCIFFPPNFQKNKQRVTMIWRVSINFTELERKKDLILIGQKFPKKATVLWWLACRAMRRRRRRPQQQQRLAAKIVVSSDGLEGKGLSWLSLSLRPCQAPALLTFQPSRPGSLPRFSSTSQDSLHYHQLCTALVSTRFL